MTSKDIIVAEGWDLVSRVVKAVLAVVVIIVVLVAVIVITAPKDEVVVIGQTERLAAIPDDAVKVTPDMDLNAPVIHYDDWADPVPMASPISTAGAEDSPFITPNGTWFFFFFTPDASVPAEQQLTDGVTGIWWSHLVGDEWSSPEKINLCDDVSLDGAQFVLGKTMWFASIRTGNYNEIDIYTASYKDGVWTDVENAGEQLNVDYDIGEFHITSDGETMYFHTGDLDYGEDMDIWVTHLVSGSWTEPEKVVGVNSEHMDGYPYISYDGREMWFTSDVSTLGYAGPAIFRSVLLSNGTWSTPVEIVSNFAGEPTLDADGNLYFVHHYFDAESQMLEADIYVAYAQ